jgi:hypothetical protein
MNTFRVTIAALLLALASAPSAPAQEQNVPAAPPQGEMTVTLSVSEKGVRFAAPGGFGQMRLEVFDSSGATVYNSDFQPGTERDWYARDRQDQPLADGTYLCVVTVRDLSGRMVVKQGAVSVQGGQPTVQFGGAGAVQAGGGGDASTTATANRLAKFDTAGGLVDSNVTEDAQGNVGVGSAPAPSVRLNISSPFGTLPFAFTQNAPESAFPTLALFSTSDGALGQYAATRHNGAGTFLMGGMAGKNFGVFANNSYNAPQLFVSANGDVGVGTTAPQARLDVAGNLRVTGDAVIDGNIAAKYQDVAEWVPGRGELPAGTVVVLDRARTNGVVPSRRAYSTHVAGVVSAQPGVILGEGGEGKVMVATTGRVKVKADATRLPIRIGDLLVVGGGEGIAMRSVPVRAGGAWLHRPGTIIGKALEPLAKGRGEILVLLSLQ